MHQGSEHARYGDYTWLIICCILSSIYCLFTATHTGPTCDEPGYVVLGVEAWRLGSSGLITRMGTMPLPIDVTTLPLHILELIRGRRIDPCQEFDTMLMVARAGTLVFWWAVLVYGWKAGCSLAGRWGGRLAVILLACEPALLAHASLATTDVAITACMLALVYHFREGRTSGWRLRVGVPSVLFGLALLSKASAVVMGPFCMFIVELDRLAQNKVFIIQPKDRVVQFLQRSASELSPFYNDLKQIFGLGFLFMLVYCGSDWQPEASFVAWAKTLPHGALASVMVYTAEHLRIFNNGAEGIIRQIKHNNVGHGVFIAEKTDPRALWYYFPVALTMKLTASALMLPVVVALLKPKALWNWMTVLTGALILFSVTFRVQIGIRLILPLVAFFITGVSGAAVNMVKALDLGWQKRTAIMALTGCVLWAALSSLLVWPNALCYFNELWGGTAEGYKLLSDSNYDWGQGLRELRQWQERNDIKDLDVWYFGSDPDMQKGPFHPVTIGDEHFEGPDDFAARFKGRYLAVSTTNLYGGYYIENPKKGQHIEKEALVAIHCLKSMQPFARTTTFLIYHFK